MFESRFLKTCHFEPVRGTRVALTLNFPTFSAQREVQDYIAMSFFCLVQMNLETCRIMAVDGDVDLYYETRIGKSPQS